MFDETSINVCPHVLLKGGSETAAHPLRLYRTADSDRTAADWTLYLWYEAAFCLSVNSARCIDLLMV